MSMSSIEPKTAYGSIPEMSIVSVTPGNEPCEDADDQSKLELNFMDCFKGSSPKESDLHTKSASLLQKAKKRTYNCKFCNGQFSTVQALGGHQNAHKRERALAKNSINATAAAWKEIDSLLNPYWRMARKPYGSLNKTLGVQMQSVIHKPYNHCLNSVLGHGYQGWPRANLNPQTAIHQTQVSRLEELAMSGLIGGFKPLEMTNLNSANQQVAEMVIRGNYNKGTYSSQNQQNENLGVDLSLKL